MMSLTKPTRPRMEATLKGAHNECLSYGFAGCIETGATPKGFNCDSSRGLLGSGEATWSAAVQSFSDWQFMPKSMVEIVASGPIEVGRVVGVLFCAFGIWAFNPCRILKLHNESGESQTTFGFTYGTLPGHVEKGEERFLLTWNHSSDEVWYEIDAVSRPNHFLVWLIYPYTRTQQAKFRTESGQSMLAAVAQTNVTELTTPVC